MDFGLDFGRWTFVVDFEVISEMVGIMVFGPMDFDVYFKLQIVKVQSSFFKVQSLFFQSPKSKT